MNKKFEYVDDNPGSYFGMLVESLNESNDYSSEVKDYNIYAIKKDGSSTLVKTIHGTIRDVESEINGKYSYLPKLSFVKKIEVRDADTDEKVFDKSLTEDKFVPQDKMSKKAQKELNDKKRGTWGNTNPVTRVQPNKKAYDRKRDKKVVEESFDNDVNVLVNLLSDKYCDEDGIVTKDSYDSVYKYLGKKYSEKIRDAVMDNLVTEFGLPAERDKKVVDEDIENKDSEEYLGVDEAKRFVYAREKLLDISDSMTTDLRLGRISREDVLYYRNEIKEIYSFLNSLYFGR